MKPLASRRSRAVLVAFGAALTVLLLHVPTLNAQTDEEAISASRKLLKRDRNAVPFCEGACAYPNACC